MKYSISFLAYFVCAVVAHKAEDFLTNAIFNIASKLSEHLLNIRQVINPDADLSLRQYLNKYGYPLEEHKIITEDDYILTLHRIPHGKKKYSSFLSRFHKQTTKPVVVLKHPFLGSATDYIIVGPEKSLALMLADLGYDVWLPNCRGNKYSMEHLRFDSAPSSASFWNFSYYEKGHYDLAAVVDHIIFVSGRDNITLVAHSQGCAESLVLTSTRPEYNEKLNLMVLFAPVTYMIKLRATAIKLGFMFRHELKVLFNVTRIYGRPYSKLFSKIIKTYCNDGSPVQYICVNLIEALCGYNSPQFNASLLTIIGENVPSGHSIKEFLHYTQEIETGEFRPYDYGKNNQIQYNSPTPPSYNLTKVIAPTAVYYGRNDYATNPQAVEKLLSQLPNVILSYLNDFNHADFLFAIDAKTQLYGKVIELITKYNP